MKFLLPALWVLLALPQIALCDEAVWREYVDRQRHLAPAGDYPYMRCFEEAAREQRLPLTLLLAVARGESNFDPTARSKANALGVMQILWPDTAKHLGVDTKARLFEPCTNIHAGARYLREMLDRYDGNLHRALAAYNYGPGRIGLTGGIPKGAQWYSGYIHRHLRFVLNGSGSGRQTLLVFDRPYRAEAFVLAVERRVEGIALDWRRTSSGDFEVAFVYQGAKQRRETESRLRRAGLLFSL
ncbi:MAG: lytic transglycosylase domain-containing protein [Chromatiales bacterium]|nr:lytic transglycosylase domain-containing protein [Chromatiales bacterium]